VSLQRAGRPAGLVLAPEVLGQAIGRDEGALGGNQQGQHEALARAAQGHRPVGADHLHGAEDQVAHVGLLPESDPTVR
jgi:hypothetical protein